MIHIINYQIPYLEKMKLSKNHMMCNFCVRCKGCRLVNKKCNIMHITIFIT